MCSFMLVPLCGAGCERACAPRHLSGKCLSPQATVYVSSIHAGPPVGILGVSVVCLHGVWCPCSNDQQVCSIVSVSSGDHTRLRAIVWIRVWVHVHQNHRIFCLFFPPGLIRGVFTACIADAMSVSVLASYSSLPWDQKTPVWKFNQSQILFSAKVWPLIKV